MLTFVRGLLAASVLVWTVPASFAQDPAKVAPARDRVAPAKESPAASRASEGSVDAILVKCLIKENENEVAVARLAQKKASSKEVQAFAEKMIEEHSACVTKLQKFGGAHSAVSVREIPRDAVRDTPRDKKAEVPGRNAEGSTLSTMMQIGDELSKKCLATTLRELEQKDGAEFDRCYMGGQIMCHLKLADTLAVYQKYAGSDLEAALREGEKTTKEHLAHAKRIYERLGVGRRQDDRQVDEPLRLRIKAINNRRERPGGVPYVFFVLRAARAS